MSAFDIDEKLVKKLAKLLEETGLSEIEYEADDRRIRVSAKAAANAVMMPSLPQVPAVPGFGAIVTVRVNLAESLLAWSSGVALFVVVLTYDREYVTVALGRVA